MIDQLAFLRRENELKPTDRPPTTVSEYVEGKRVLPPSTPFPGLWRNSRTPYAVEIMNNMSPSSPVMYTDVMKGAQIGMTATGENVIAYWMDANPAEVLYVSATVELLAKWGSKRLEPLIDSCGFRDKIHAQSDVSAKTRKSGDRTFSKEYVGGALDMASAQSASSLRSDSKRILVLDEVDSAPRLLRTGEGYWIDVAEARTNAWGHRKKILAYTTPELLADSVINERYLIGDQRAYMVPCPHCGKMQPLEFGTEKGNHGLRPEREAGELVNAHYICQYCHEAIFNYHKGGLLTGGAWEPTAESCRPNRRSYQIGSIYSPVGMMSWRELYEKYEAAQDAPDGMRSFTNLYLGLPYKETGKRPQLDNVIKLKGAYFRGTVPDDVLFITVGVDVQRGSKRDKLNPARLEMEILGHGVGYRTWSIDYRVFGGATDDPQSGAWALVQEWAESGGLAFKRRDGSEVAPSLIFIDSGDGEFAGVVYRFCAGWAATFPSKGFSALSKRKNEKGDELTINTFKRFRESKVGADVTLYTISTNYYKTLLYRNLRLEREDTDVQRPGFCDFPIDYPPDYFKGLTAEEKWEDGSFHCPSGVRNEPIDCRAYAMCAADVFLDSRVKAIRDAMKQKGATQAQMDQVDSRTVLHTLQRGR